MHTEYLLAAVLAAVSCGTSNAAITTAECAKCPMRMRLKADLSGATINLSKVAEAEVPALRAKAEKLLALGTETKKGGMKRPLMGWSSWNTFGVDISDAIILSVAEAMATNGLAAAGYVYVNIDDGFFNGHGPDGRLRFHAKRFPAGMKPVVDGIHALGLKAGTYSDAGINTCGSIWSNDPLGKGSGLYGHDAADCALHFNELGFDFIKVDYCGGMEQKLEERARYMEIARAIRATGREVRFNICRWAFPGVWAADIAESWRTTHDIRASWKSVIDILGENLYLGQFISPGHYNDLDMLEVGHRFGKVKTAFGKDDCGLTEDEETAHFGLWCFMSSPLLLGCDPRTIPEFTLKLVTNPYLLMMNQNDLAAEPHVAVRDGGAYVFVKDADEANGTARYAALYNPGDAAHDFRVRFADLLLGGKVAAVDLVEMADIGEAEGEFNVTVAAHSAKFYRLDAERRLERTLYEAEDALLPAYSELDPSGTGVKNEDLIRLGRPVFGQRDGASGGVVVLNLGGDVANDLIWRDVRVSAAGEYTLSFAADAPEGFLVSVDGAIPLKWRGADLKVTLAAGVHTVRILNDRARIPAVDYLRLVR